MRQLSFVMDGALEYEKKIDVKITHVASCSFWHSLMGLDKKLKPTSPIYMWNDNRSKRFVGRLREAFNETTIHNRTGARFHTSYWPAKLLWLREDFPDIWEKTHMWVSFADWAAMRFCGKMPTTTSMASGTGLFDIRKLKWDKELLEFLKVDEEQLPTVEDNVISTPQMKSRWHERWPSIADAMWLPTIGDGAASNVGSQCTNQNRAALMIGTSAAARVLYEGDPPKKLPRGVFCYRLDEKRVVVGGAMNDGGALYNWLKDTMRFDISIPKLAREFDKRALGGHGLTFEPYLGGQRSPDFDEFATGSISGLTMDHDAVDIMLAGMEAVAYRLKDILDQLQELFPFEEIMISGGALRESPAWRKIVSQVLDRGLIAVDEPEPALKGAVVYAHERFVDKK